MTAALTAPVSVQQVITLGRGTCSDGNHEADEPPGFVFACFQAIASSDGVERVSQFD
jgi:hypothetical protein